MGEKVFRGGAYHPRRLPPGGRLWVGKPSFRVSDTCRPTDSPGRAHPAGPGGSPQKDPKGPTNLSAPPTRPVGHTQQVRAAARKKTRRAPLTFPPNGLARQGTPRRVPPAAAGGKGCNHVLTGSAGQNILLSRQCARRARAAAASPNFGRGLTPSRISDTPVHYPPERSSVPACPSQNSPAEVF